MRNEAGVSEAGSLSDGLDGGGWGAGGTEFLQVGGQKKKKMIWIPLSWCFCRNGG